MLTGLVAEIGNHHFGSILKARALIRAAREAGATYVKMQAIDPGAFTGGSMPRDFYRQCDLGLERYNECVQFGDEIGIPVFFSVFGPKYACLARYTSNKPYKISGAQFQSFSAADLALWNGRAKEHGPVVLSIPRVDLAVLEEKAASVTNMDVMYVTPYLDDGVDFGPLETLKSALKKPIGYYDHSTGLSSCIKAVGDHGCRLVEKHFNIFGLQTFSGAVYRDSVHAANARQLEMLAKYLEMVR